jgi:hypothetical protein
MRTAVATAKMDTCPGTAGANDPAEDLPMAALKPVALHALVAAAAGAVARAGWSRRHAVPARTGFTASPLVAPLFPPLPVAPGEAAVWRRAGGNERPALPPEAFVGFLGH